MAGRNVVRVQRGAGHIAVFLAHWAGGHTVSEEEIIRRIVKRRLEAHTAAVAEHGRLGKAAHKKATKLRRSAAENGGLVPAHQTALAAAEFEATRHDAAISLLGAFEAPVLDPGHVRHRRHRIAAWRCVVLTMPVAGVLAASWEFSGMVFLWSVIGGVAACGLRGDQPFKTGVRAVPAELVAATPMVLPIAGAEAEPEALPVDTGEWKTELRLYVEHAVAAADLDGRAAVHVADLLHGLQQSGRFLGLTTKTFPAKLRDAGIPTRVATIAGTGGLAVRYDALAQALGHQPTLPAHLVPDLTDDTELYVGETTPVSPSPAQKRAG
ncbi:hypothetical protein [Kitasatospora sp. MBT63]|uniref:hypothetical protein n=1 Tax=Kitasatospora sp. MBT63 TaxID=1444768 RepID=UPI00053A28C2|nr:hypothetical protein [Kitasatospora sp. MBT63]